MPRWDSSAPRKKLPPPTTIAHSTPWATPSAISPAMRETTSGSTPTAPPPKASPESLRRTRRPSCFFGRTGIGDVMVWLMSILPRWVLGDDTGAAPHRWCGAAGWWPRSRMAGELWGSRGWSAADAEADETGDGAAGLLHDLADRLLRVLREALVQQHVLLVEAVQPALDDLGQGLLGLALVLGGLLRDAALVLDDVGGHLVTVEVGRGEGGDVHGDVARDLGPGCIGGHQHTDLRGQVLVGAVHVGADDLARDPADAAHQDLLAHAGTGVGQGLTEGGLGEIRGLLGAGLDGGGHGLVTQGDELVVLGHEVGLGVQLDQGAGLAALAVSHVDGDETLGGGAALTLGDALQPLDADQLDGLGLVAFRLVQSLLDVEHARTGGLADLLDVGCRVVRHICLPRGRDVYV